MIFLIISFEESFFIILFAIILFGPKKIPEIARGIGNIINQIKLFKKEIEDEIWNTKEDLNLFTKNKTNKHKK